MVPVNTRSIIDRAVLVCPCVIRSATPESVYLSADLAVATAAVTARTTRDDLIVRFQRQAAGHLDLVHQGSAQHRADLATKDLAILDEALARLVGTERGHDGALSG